MRKLNGGDLFAAFRAMRKIDLKETADAFSNKVAKAETEEDEKEANMALFEALLKNVTDPKTEELIFGFLAGPFEKKNAAAVRSMDLDELGQCLEQLATENDLKLFFARARRLIQTK